MIDMHSHVLPGIDDGSKSPEMSLEMLRESYKQGIDIVTATSHFYIKDDSVESFISKREKAYGILKEFIKNEKELPDIYLGAEVFYFNGISKIEGLEKLCINNSQYLLLEMPFNKWTSRVFQEVEDIIYNRGLTPVIAHIERFIPFQKGTNNIERLLGMKVIAQMNGEHILSFFTKGKALKLIENGSVRILGSDMHNTQTRPQNLGKAVDIVKSKLGERVIDDMINLSREILGINERGELL